VRVNVVPMIDVVMCLIVFYLMVGQLALNRAAGVRIPETDGALLLDGEPTTAERLAGELTGRTARQPDARVEVRADRDTPYGLIRPALNAARDAGIAEVELVTERSG
jgi:biopolymer transport protein ExbD